MGDVAPTIDQVAPGLVTRVRPGELGIRNAVFMGGLLLTLASIILAFVMPKDAINAYLVGYMYVLTISLGALFFVMIQHITRAGWSVVVRRVAENIMAFLFPWAPILFIPLAVNYDVIWHHWAHAVTDPTAAGYDEVMAHKAGYFDLAFFFGRAVLYFAIWAGLVRFFRGLSLQQDADGNPVHSTRMAGRAAPGLALFALTITFAAIDWVMSIDPHWFSTIFGVTVFAGAHMSFLAGLSLMCLWLGRSGYLKETINQEHYHDIGKLLFGFMIFWTYTNFSQYMLIWYANLPEETMWYGLRADTIGGESLLPWGYVGTLLVVGHFLVPFAFLLSRHIKRNRLTLTLGAIWLLAMHYIDLQYLIMPDHHPDGFHFGLIEIVTFVGPLLLLVGVTMKNLAETPLVPERDPRLAESIHFHNI